MLKIEEREYLCDSGADLGGLEAEKKFPQITLIWQITLIYDVLIIFLESFFYGSYIVDISFLYR